MRKITVLPSIDNTNFKKNNLLLISIFKINSQEKNMKNNSMKLEDSNLK